MDYATADRVIRILEQRIAAVRAEIKAQDTSPHQEQDKIIPPHLCYGITVEGILLFLAEIGFLVGLPGHRCRATKRVCLKRGPGLWLPAPRRTRRSGSAMAASLHSPRAKAGLLCAIGSLAATPCKYRGSNWCQQSTARCGGGDDGDAKLQDGSSSAAMM